MLSLGKYGYFIFYSARASLRQEVANSYLNWIWWILDPFLNMCVYTFVFGTIFGMSEPNFPVFIFSALIMWNFFSKSINASVKLVRRHKNIISKVYVPKYILLLENMALNAYKMLFALMVLVIMMIIFKIHVTMYMIWLIPILFVLFVFTFGVGLILLHFGVFIDDLGYAIGILLKMLMYLSGVMYNIDRRLAPNLARLLKIVNPMALLINDMHNVLLYEKMPTLDMELIWFFLSCILCIIGIFVVRRYENSYVKVI